MRRTRHHSGTGFRSRFQACRLSRAPFQPKPVQSLFIPRSSAVKAGACSFYFAVGVSRQRLAHIEAAYCGFYGSPLCAGRRLALHLCGLYPFRPPPSRQGRFSLPLTFWASALSTLSKPFPQGQGVNASGSRQP